MLLYSSRVVAVTGGVVGSVAGVLKVLFALLKFSF